MVGERHDIHFHFELVLPAAVHDSFERGHIGVVATPGQHRMLFTGQGAVGGVQG